MDSPKSSTDFRSRPDWVSPHRMNSAESAMSKPLLARSWTEAFHPGQRRTTRTGPRMSPIPDTLSAMAPLAPAPPPRRSRVGSSRTPRASCSSTRSPARCVRWPRRKVRGVRARPIPAGSSASARIRPRSWPRSTSSTGLSFRVVPDAPPYPLSSAFGLRVVPTDVRARRRRDHAGRRRVLGPRGAEPGASGGWPTWSARPTPRSRSPATACPLPPRLRGPQRALGLVPVPRLAAHAAGDAPVAAS